MIAVAPMPQPALPIAQPLVVPSVSFDTVLANSVVASAPARTPAPSIAPTASLATTPTSAPMPLPDKSSAAQAVAEIIEIPRDDVPEQNDKPIAQAEVAEKLPEMTSEQNVRLPDLTPVAQVIAAVTQVANEPAKAPTPSAKSKRGEPAEAGIIALPAQILIVPFKPAERPTDAIAVAAPAAQIFTSPFDPAPILQASAEPVAFALPTTTPASGASLQIARNLDLASDLAWLGNLAQEIVSASTLTSSDRDTLSFRLLPQVMGQLDVSLSRLADGLQIEMSASTERATQIIAAEQPRLIEELRQSGLKMADTDPGSGQHPGSQRGHASPRGDLPGTESYSRTATNEQETRPAGRFA
ncbi:hypothetical protein FM036_47580 [Nostoc sp. HG1]|nr:hypothetical protein [Nostoc sp. HG1]